MMFALAVSHCDQRQALRLMGWLGWLSECHGNSMLNERILIVASKRASLYPKHKMLCWLAARIFGEARCFIPPVEHEVGWPGAANWMFKNVLEHIEEHFGEDVFFLEPDGIPIYPYWFDAIKDGYRVARSNGKPFMGAYVPHTPSHMTGISVYGRDWRRFAPSLVSCPDHDAWDTHSAFETVPNCHFTKLIQHVFKRHDKGWLVPALGILDKEAVVFHQDKAGRLIRLLDQGRHQYGCEKHPIFSYNILDFEDPVMRKFYQARNCTKAIMAHGTRILFEPVDAFAGSIPGVYTTENESEQVALTELTGNPSTGVTEISQNEWEKLSKKAAPAARNSNTSKTSNGHSGQMGLPDQATLMPQASLLPTPSQSPAVLVVDPASAPIKGQLTPNAPIKNIEDVIRVDTVQPAEMINIGTKLPRPHMNVNRPKEASV